MKKLFSSEFKFKIKDVLYKFLNKTKIFKISFAQTGEDLIVNNIFEYKTNGFYVEIGAFHPFIYSNTNLFHKDLNWKGINIDPNPFSIEKFKKYRPEDINLNIAIANTYEKLKYYYVDDTNSMNSMSEEFLLKRGINPDKIKNVEIECLPLKNVLDKYLPEGQNVDLFNIDVEGFEIEVLKSNDWDKYKPEVIIMECESDCIDDLNKLETVRFLLDLNYKIISYVYSDKNLKNVIFQLKP